MPDQRKVVVISSTSIDLPEHRKEVEGACLRQSMFPQMMEHLPASDADAIAESLRLIDEADIYLGIFAHRYGYVPRGHQISITEMEYNRAVERSIPRLIFLMHDDHPVKASDVEKGEGAIKLEAFKSRLKTERVVGFFKSPADLRALVIDSLSNYHERDTTVFHYVRDIPAPPETYIAHPYTLLQTRDLVGRQRELNLLTDWVAEPDAAVYQARIFNFVAIGGMGKSALTWKWFNDIAPHEMKPLAGRMWWSFYESDATFENFIIRALAYVSGRAREDVEKNTTPGEREDELLGVLNREPFLLVLDGLERILIAYARMDANRLADDDLDKRAANFVAGAIGLPESAGQSFIGQHLLRKTADPRAGNFLRKLARVQSSRVLVSTRLYPADLQTGTGGSLPSSVPCFLLGLTDDAALNLWRAFGVSGSREELLRLFRSFQNHPLLIHALASEIAHDRRAAGDFDTWRNNHRDFDPFSMPLVQARSHVLAFALRGLKESQNKALQTIAAFRMPATYDTLVAILVGEDKIFPNENALDATLTELEDRGLLGWDKQANRYDLHPIVRGVVWSGLSNDTRRGVYTTLHAHFEAVPKLDYTKISSLEDLTPAIELYNTLIGLERYDKAARLFYERLQDAMHYRLRAGRQLVELMEMLFPSGLDQLPRLSTPDAQAYALIVLGLAYALGGQPGYAVLLYRRANIILANMKNANDLGTGLDNLSHALRLSGALYQSESAVRQSLIIKREQQKRFEEPISLYWLGLTLVTRGIVTESESALQRSLRMFIAMSQKQAEGNVNYFLAKRALWLGEYENALSLANRAWKLAHTQTLEGDFIRASLAQGEAALRLNDFEKADERLHHALIRARKVNMVEEELLALVALAELRHRQGDLGAARELLDSVWEMAERGPYPLIHADALNVLARIEHDAGNNDKAIEAAINAYRKAWCDGPPFAYHWGLEAARKTLAELGATEPTDLPPFDESKFEPMPEVEIDPELIHEGHEESQRKN